VTKVQWRRQLCRLPTILFLVHFGVNLAANYPSMV